MPEVKHYAFVVRHPTTVNQQITTFFRWDDDPLEDSAFRSYIDRQSNVASVSIDRSGPEPVLNWTQDSVSHSEPCGPAGTYWHYYFRDLSSGYFFVTKFGSEVPGYWECDDHGRPLDLNDLLP